MLKMRSSLFHSCLLLPTWLVLVFYSRANSRNITGVCDFTNHLILSRIYKGCYVRWAIYFLTRLCFNFTHTILLDYKITGICVKCWEISLVHIIKLLRNKFLPIILTAQFLRTYPHTFTVELIL